MRYIVAKAISRFNKEQDQSENMAVEAVQVFNSEDEAEAAWSIFANTDVDGEYIYIIITEDQIGEWVR